MSIFDNKKVLITGATGMICSSFIQFLMNNTTAKVYALGRSDKKLRDIFSSYFILQIQYTPLNLEILHIRFLVLRH